MHWFKFHFVLLNFLVLKTVLYQTCAVGCQVEFSSKSGTIAYRRSNRSYKVNCSWIFSYNSSGEVAFRLKFLLSEGNEKRDESVTLPDGSVLPEKTINSTSKWCAVYVKAPGSQNTSCVENVTIANICDQATVRSQQWPPTITIHVWSYTMQVDYDFVDCKAWTTTTTANETHTASTTRTTKVAENPIVLYETTGFFSAEVTTSRNSPRNRSKVVAQETVGRNLAAVSVVLAVLFLIALLALLAVLFKYRTLQSRMAKNSKKSHASVYRNDPSSDNNMYAMATAPSQATNSVANGEREMVDNELYTANDVREEKQTVYNGLYAANDVREEKQTVYNELYAANNVLEEKQTVYNELYKA